MTSDPIDTLSITPNYITITHSLHRLSDLTVAVAHVQPRSSYIWNLNGVCGLVSANHTHSVLKIEI